MSVREFDATDDRLVVDNGSTTAWNKGNAFTLFVLMNPATAGDSRPWIGANRSNGGSLGTIYTPGPGNIALGADEPGADSNAGVSLTTNAWQLIAITSDGGGATPRLHRKLLGSGSWTHADGSVTFGTATSDLAAWTFGSFSSTGSNGTANARFAFGAVWHSAALADSDLEDFDTAASTLAIYEFDPAPTALWEFNQAAVGTDVTDLMGSGADQTSLTGTTVIEGDDPAWTFGLGGAPWEPEVDSPATLHTVASPLRAA